MFRITRWLGALLGPVVVTCPSLAQNAPWPPPAGMSDREYLRRYGGEELRRANPEFYRSLPQPPRQQAPSAPAAASRPPGVNVEYNYSTGRYELPCPPATRSDPYAPQKSEYNPYTGKYEVPCSK